MKLFTAIVICLILITGCSRKTPQPNVPGRVAYSPSLEPLIGEWDAEDGFALIVKRIDNEIVVDNPQSDTLRYEISGATASDRSITFTQHHRMQDGSYSAFGEVPCKCIIAVVDGKPDSLNFSLSIPQSPKVESELYTRRKPTK